MSSDKMQPFLRCQKTVNGKSIFNVRNRDLLERASTRDFLPCVL